MQVFISHDSVDGEFAHHLAADLQRLGVRVWIAPESICPGEGWVDAINRGLKGSSHVVVVLTPAAVESEWVRTETSVAIAQAHRGQMQVIPLEVKPCEVPLLWGNYQMISFRRGYDAGLRDLAAVLGLHAASPGPVRQVRYAPQPVPEPEVAIAAGDVAYKVNRELCRGEACAVCVDVCPAEAISMVDGRAHIDPDSCIECDACVAECPDEAIVAGL
jgi:NAD-dependent dihydropyrimidine dehydrogenase PreA subunit